MLSKQKAKVLKLLNLHPKLKPNDMAIRAELQALAKAGITFEDCKKELEPIAIDTSALEETLVNKAIEKLSTEEKPSRKSILGKILNK